MDKLLVPAGELNGLQRFGFFYSLYTNAHANCFSLDANVVRCGIKAVYRGVGLEAVAVLQVTY